MSELVRFASGHDLLVRLAWETGMIRAAGSPQRDGGR